VSDRAQREVELKLELPPEAVSRVSRHRSLERYGEGPVTTRRLRSIYFDTVDRALLHAGLSLRIREIGDGDPLRRARLVDHGEERTARAEIRRTPAHHRAVAVTGDDEETVFRHCPSPVPLLLRTIPGAR